MLSVDDALALILRHTPLGPVESVPLEEAAGCVLAEEVRADRDSPPFHRAMMDGYAVRSVDLVATPTSLRVVGEVAAGATRDLVLERGQAVRIMTGAPVPAGADAVVRVEDTEAPAPEEVRVRSGVSPGRNITPRGVEVGRGDRVLAPPLRIGPAELGVLAAVGAARVRARRPPRVAVLSTGDELVEAHESPGPASIRDANSWSLAALGRGEGLAVERLGIAGDSAGALRTAIAGGLAYDLLVLSGGVSMGVYDLVRPILLEAGVHIHFEQVRLKPGKPAVFGTRGQAAVFGLPGNPVSAFLTWLLFVRTAARAMQADPDATGHRVRARLAGDPVRTLDRRLYLPVRLEAGPGGETAARPVDWHGSGDLYALVRADGFAAIPEDAGLVAPGSPVEVIPYRPGW
ncbi:MAG: molybdopterin molybdotransferase MoeA [Planctomycetes bacterium]|nr:molybdopterin molybdotransferase MoeA [Planctomycetota bacterium]